MDALNLVIGLFDQPVLADTITLNSSPRWPLNCWFLSLFLLLPLFGNTTEGLVFQ
jgi:hypothetical protein